MPVSDLDSRVQAGPVQDALRNLRAADDHALEGDLPALEATLNGAFPPDWETLHLLARLVRGMSPRHIIAFGCDASTELLALLGFADGRMAVTAYEHDPWAAEEWINAASPYAVNYRWFSFALCPLVARWCGDAPQPVYDDGMTQPVVPHPADLILVNGPPAALGGRGGVIYQALRYARPGTIILVLDVRQGEAAMFEAWVSGLDQHLHFAPPGLLGRHLAFIVCQSLAAPFQLERPREQAASSAARLAG